MYRQFSAARAGRIFSDWNGVRWFASSQSSAPIEKLAFARQRDKVSQEVSASQVRCRAWETM